MRKNSKLPGEPRKPRATQAEVAVWSAREFYRLYGAGWVKVLRDKKVQARMHESMRKQAEEDPLQVAEEIIPLIRELLKKENDADDRDVKFTWAADYGIGKITQKTDSDTE